MAVSIDNVYQKVLALANKEQRGYITPQEFNLLANKAQMDIFEAYFHEIGGPSQDKGNSTVYADKIDSIKEKIAIYEKFNQYVSMDSNSVGTLPSNYKIGRLSYNSKGQDIQVTGDVSNHANIFFGTIIDTLGLAIGDEVYSTLTGTLLGTITVLKRVEQLHELW